MTNQTSADKPASPFLAHLGDQLPVLTKNIARQLHADQVGPFGGLTAEQAEQQVATSIKPYFQALLEQSHTPLSQNLSQVLRPSIIQLVSIETLLQITAIYRSYALDFGLAAVVAGVPESREGVQQLMKLFDLATQSISQTYQAQLRLFQSLADNAPDGIGVADLDGNVTYANAMLCSQMGFGDAIIGMPVTSLVAPEDQHKLGELRDTFVRGESWRGTLRYQRNNGDQFTGEVSSYLLRDDNNNALATVAIIRDISAQMAAEAERQQLQQQVIEAQQAALAELSTPVIPISDQVMVMPLIGSIDSGRAGQLVERLLEGVVGNHASTAIIDITGVPVVDTQVAQTLLRAAQAASLVGARVILTGIRPEVAQTLVGLGVDMGAIITRSTLQSGITYALESGTAKR